jgi:hypothetical protein
MGSNPLGDSLSTGTVLGRRLANLREQSGQVCIGLSEQILAPHFRANRFLQQF